MNQNRISRNVKDIDKLGDRLSKYDEVKRLDDSKMKEGHVLAHCFGDLEESFLAFLNIHLPRLMKVMDEDLDDEEIGGVLQDIREEFRHILYHIRDPKYFQCLFPVDDWKSE